MVARERSSRTPRRCAAAFALAASAVAGEPSIRFRTSDATSSALGLDVELAPDSIATAIVRPGGRAGALAIAAPGRTSRWIVTLRAASGASDERERFVDAGRRFVASVAGGTGVSVRRLLSNLAPIAVVDASEARADEIRRRADVASVVADDTVSACATDVSGVIHADAYWTGLGVSGAGVTVAIVDSGIDWTHPDLGGAFGPGARVVGGFDFVNDDDSPMDDFGHGTHVAGIVAASGDVRGVAWGARLLAYKVLDRRGQGRTSDVLAALDLAADPDGDPRTADAPAVINLSLGGPPSDDDPLLPAIASLRARGILCVVAAGNAGPDFSTITSPGTSPDALTVGASDASDLVPAFSSRGPTAERAVKPDLVAPGIDVRSTWLGGGTRVLSGTSMATAVASGAAALVFAANPGIRSDDVAAVLASSSSPIAGGPWRAGAGRLDLARSSRAGLVASGRSLSLGLDDPARPAFAASASLRVAAIGAGRDVRTRLEGVLPAGAHLEVAPASFALAAGESREIAVSLAVDNALAPDAEVEPFAFDGALVCSCDGAADVRVPVAWFKAPELVVELDEAPWTLLVRGPRGANLLASPGARVSRLVPRGVYDLVALFRDGTTFSAREALRVDGATDVALRKVDARRRVTLRPLDEGARPLSATLAGLELRHEPSGTAQVLLGGLASRFAFSDLGPDWRVTWTAQARSGGALYQVGGATSGVTGDLTLANDAERLRRSRLRATPDDGEGRVRVATWLTYLADSSAWAMTAYRNDVELAAPFETDLVLAPPPDGPHPFFVQCALARPDALPFRTTAHLDGGGRGLRGFVWGDARPALDVAPGLLDAGRGPARLFAGLRNRPSALRVDALAGHLNLFFLDAFAGFAPRTGLGWELWQSGARAQSGTFASAGGDGTGSAVEEIPVVPGAWELRVQTDRATVDRGLARVTWRVDTRRANADGSGDADPPDLVEFAILDSSGLPSDEIDPPAGGELRFALHDTSDIRRVAVTARIGDVERPLAIEPDGESWRASLSPLPSGARIALRLEAEDAGGNAFDLLLDPALRTSGQLATTPAIESLEPRCGGVDEAIEVTLHGRGFATGALLRISFGGADATDVRVLDDGVATCRAPSTATPGPADVEVATASGAARAPAAFLYLSLPRNEACRRGNVDAAHGAPASVLSIVGGASDGVGARLDRGEAFSLVMSPSPAGPAPAGFVLYAFASQPNASTLTPLPWSIGTSCLPLPLGGAAPGSVQVLANSLGHRARLGRPLRESAAAPTSLPFRRGLRGPATLTVQGLLEDQGSTGPGVSLTNALVLWVP